jgi:Putative phage metallopeptidase
MGVTYELVDVTVNRLISEVLAQPPHSDLGSAEVTIQAVFANNVGEDGNLCQAVKVHGYPAVAKIQVTSLIDRVYGSADAKLTICHYSWSKMDKLQRVAMIDHELTHLVTVTDQDGVLKRDDCCRPKLRLRAHDFEVGWFGEVAKRHGESAVEVFQIRCFNDQWGYLFRHDAGDAEAMRRVKVILDDAYPESGTGN